MALESWNRGRDVATCLIPRQVVVCYAILSVATLRVVLATLKQETLCVAVFRAADCRRKSLKKVSCVGRGLAEACRNKLGLSTLGKSCASQITFRQNGGIIVQQMSNGVSGHTVAIAFIP